jgi:hypothetical protein
LEPGYRYGLQHLLAGAHYVYALLGEDGRILLASQPHVESGIHHQIAARLELVSNRGIVRALEHLYWDDSTSAIRRGAMNAKAAGSVYRFIDVVQQLEVNFDLYGMSEKAILGLLPAEFDRWRSVKQGLLSRLAGWGKTAAARTPRTEPVGRRD